VARLHELFDESVQHFVEVVDQLVMVVRSVIVVTAGHIDHSAPYTRLVALGSGVGHITNFLDHHPPIATPSLGIERQQFVEYGTLNQLC